MWFQMLFFSFFKRSFQKKFIDSGCTPVCANWWGEMVFFFPFSLWSGWSSWICCDSLLAVLKLNDHRLIWKLYLKWTEGESNIFTQICLICLQFFSLSIRKCLSRSLALCFWSSFQMKQHKLENRTSQIKDNDGQMFCIKDKKHWVKEKVKL